MPTAFHAAARNMLCGRLAGVAVLLSLARALSRSLSLSLSSHSLALLSLFLSLSLSLALAAYRRVGPCNVRSFSQRSGPHGSSWLLYDLSNRD